MYLFTELRVGYKNRVQSFLRQVIYVYNSIDHDLALVGPGAIVLPTQLSNVNLSRPFTM